MAEFIEFKTKEELELDAELDKLIENLIRLGYIKSEKQKPVSLVEKPAFNPERIKDVQNCLDLLYDLLESKQKSVIGKVDVGFFPNSKKDVVIESKLKSMHIDNVSDFISKFSKADNIDICPLCKKNTFGFDVLFRNVATPVPVGKDGANNE